MKFVISLILVFFITTFCFASEDPFADLRNHINAISTQIKKSGIKEACYNQFGKDIEPFFKTIEITPEQQEKEFANKELSVRFESQIKAFEEEIFTNIVKNGAISNISCSKEGVDILKAELSKLQAEKNELRIKVLKSDELYKKYGKEYDPQTKESYVFQETQKTWENLMKKFEIIKGSLNTLKTPSFSDFSISEEQTNRAKSNAQSYKDAFWSNITYNIFAPLYEERSNILRNLKGLPDRKSKRTTLWSGNFEEIFTQEKNSEIEKKKQDYLSNNINNVNTIEQAIQLSTKVQNEVYNYNQEIKEYANTIEKIERFAEPNTKSMINTLNPAIESIKTTSQHLKKVGEILEKRNGQQSQ